MKKTQQITNTPQDGGIPGVFSPPLETASALLEGRLEEAGKRISAYLRHLPLPERSRHELALAALTELANDPGDTPGEAEARGMRILRSMLAERQLPLFVVPGPGLRRSHMKPEEMDRRPWVRTFVQLWRPLWCMVATFFNTSLIDFLLYALLLAGLYALDFSMH